MAIYQSLLDKSRKSVSKTVWSILFVGSVISSLLLIASYVIQPTSFFNLSPSHHIICEHAIDTESCSAHVSEVAQTPILTTQYTQGYRLNLLQSILTKSTSHIQKAIDTANAVKLRINSPKEEAGLVECEELMDLSMDRVWDSIVALSKKSSADSMQDAHSWLSSVLTNHATCLDGLEGYSARTLMEAEVKDLISRARTSLALLVAI
ncbi:pectinesterase inhibitor domain-containing protein, partial [Escherichia coli]|nr:pectinesterase inhibitor domain-containing protein [Escherichia coli]